MKLDRNGNIVWQKSLGGSYVDDASSIRQTSDGGFIVAGSSYSNNGDVSGHHGSDDYWVVKLSTGVQSCLSPANLSATDITSTSAKLNWDAVTNAEKYKVRYEVDATNDWITLNPVAHHKVITGLSPNTEYTWQVKTVCQVDSPNVTSPWSAKQHFTTTSSRLMDESTQPVIQIYPNPAYNHADIQFTLLQSSSVRMVICDLSGKEIEVLVNDQLQSGRHSIQLYI